MGAVLVCVPMGVLLLLCGFSAAWYLFMDNNSSFWRNDPHPQFKTQDGESYIKTINPVFMLFYPYGPRVLQDARHYFEGEIHDAIERRHKQ
jgi:hypothetical protein